MEEILETLELSQKLKRIYQESVLFLKIIESTQLEADPNVIHPCVKIHILDAETGQYLKKEKMTVAIQQYENITEYKEDQTFNQNYYCDYILPMCTNFYDLRSKNMQKPFWNQEFYVDISMLNIVNRQTVILFELLDFNATLVSNKSDLVDNQGYYRICWGYLRPLGLSQINTGTSKIKLFKYKTKLDVNCYDQDVPGVYYEFIWPSKITYKGYLQVQLMPIDRPNKIITKYSTNVFEEEERKQVRDHREQNVIQIEIKDNRDFLNQFIIKDQDQFNTPDQILYKLASEKMGCLRIAFSNNGLYLACACQISAQKCIIKIFYLETGEAVFILRGHKDIIQDIKFSYCDKYLFSTGADYQLKVWSMPETPNEFIEEEDSEKLALTNTISHPSYVYQVCQVHINSWYLIASCCFDKKVRIYELEPEREMHFNVVELYITEQINKFDNFNNILLHRYPNCLQFDEQNKLYIGDSLGCLHIFILKIREITNDIDLNLNNNIQNNSNFHIEYNRIYILKITNQNEAINNIRLFKTEIYLSCRDNTVKRLILDKQNKNDYRLYQQYQCKTKNCNIYCKLSFDGQYMLVGGNDGQIIMYDTLLNQEKEIQNLDVKFKGTIMDVDFNSKFNIIAVSGYGKQFPIIVAGFNTAQNHSHDNQNNYIQIDEIPPEDYNHNKTVNFNYNNNNSNDRKVTFNPQLTNNNFTNNQQNLFDQTNPITNINRAENSFNVFGATDNLQNTGFNRFINNNNFNDNNNY